MLTAFTLPVDLDVKTMIFTAIALPLIVVFVVRLRRLLVDNFSYVLDYLVWAVGVRFHHAFAKRVSLRRYCRLQLADPATRYLQVPGPQGTELETDSIFVPLRFESGKRRRPGDLTSALEKDNRITVIGEPGSGKSSLVKQTFRQACLTGQWRPKRAALPIAVELKEFVPPERFESDHQAGRWALDELRNKISAGQGFDMARFFDSFVDGSGVLILLDGLDEVASSDYRRTAMAIRGLSSHLARRSSKNRLVLTMRSQFYEQVSGEVQSAFPSVYRLAPFTPSDIFNFLERWPFRDKKDDQISRIYSDLTDRPTLREMCRNPLVLSMYVANDQGEDGATQATPDTRTSFYDQVVRELIVERRSRQLGMAARGKLREDREQILGRLALDNLVDGAQAANSPTWKRAVEIYADVYHCSSPTEAAEGLLELEKDTGIISHERSGESLRFIHLTFCEFLGAKEAAVGRKDGFDQLLERYEEFQHSEHPQLRSRLNECIPFAAALLPRFSRQEAVGKVAETCGLEILGRCFLETQEYGGDIWQDYLDEVRSGLLRADPYQWTDEWLSRLHLFNVVLQDAERWSQISRQPIDVKLETIFAGLVGSDRKRLVKLFSSYASNDPPAALRLAESCGVDLGREYPQLVVENCEFPPFLAVALQRAEGWNDTAKRWTALLAEAGLRRRLAAMLLHGRDASEDFRRRVSRIDPKRLWRGLPESLIVISGSPIGSTHPDLSAYSAILSLALALPKEFRSDLRALEILSRVPPPAATVPASLIRILGVALGLIVLVAGQRFLSPLGPVETVLLSLLSLGAIVLCWTYPSARSRRYATMVNLGVSIVVDDATWISSEHWRGRPLYRRKRSAILRWLRERLDRVYLRRLNAALADLSDLVPPLPSTEGMQDLALAREQGAPSG